MSSETLIQNWVHPPVVLILFVDWFSGLVHKTFKPVPPQLLVWIGIPGHYLNLYIFLIKLHQLVHSMKYLVAMKLGTFCFCLVLSMISNWSFCGPIVFTSISTSWIWVLLAIWHVVWFWSMTNNIPKILVRD